MNRTRILLFVVLIFGLIAMALISVGIATNEWLVTKATSNIRTASSALGLWKWCGATDGQSACDDEISIVPAVLALVGLGLVLFGFVASAVALPFKRLPVAVALIPTLLFLLGVGILLACAAVYWFEIFNTALEKAYPNDVFSNLNISMGYSSALFFAGLGVTVLIVAISSFVAGSLLFSHQDQSKYRQPMTAASSFRQYSYYY